MEGSTGLQAVTALTLRWTGKKTDSQTVRAPRREVLSAWRRAFVRDFKQR